VIDQLIRGLAVETCVSSGHVNVLLRGLPTSRSVSRNILGKFHY
jgi:hypothetical protein